MGGASYLIPGFYLAMEMGDAEVVLHLLATHKVPPDKGVRCHEWGGPQTPCALAASLKMAKVMRALLAAGHRGTKHRSSVPLVSAGYSGCEECTRLLLEAGVEVNDREGSNDEGDSGMTALMAAAEQKHFEVFELLLNAGADPNVLSKKGVCAASLAATREESCAEFISLLIAHGCKEFGRAALFPAAHGQPEILLAMIKAGANVNVVATAEEGYREGMSAWECALRNLRSMNFIEKSHDTGKEEDREGYARFSAKLPPAQEVIKILIGAGLDLNKPNPFRSPLHAAVFYEEIGAVKMLLVAGADPNSIAVRRFKKRGTTEADPYLNTAIHVAVNQKNLEILVVLIEAGANVNRTDCEGWTPLMRALERHFPEGAELLRQAGGTESSGE